MLVKHGEIIVTYVLGPVTGFDGKIQHRLLPVGNIGFFVIGRDGISDGCWHPVICQFPQY